MRTTRESPTKRSSGRHVRARVIEKSTNQGERARLRDFGEHPGKLGHGDPVGVAVECSLDATRELGVAFIPQVTQRLPGGHSDAWLRVVQDGDQGIGHAGTGNLCAKVGQAFEAHGAFLAIFHLESTLGLAPEQRDDLVQALVTKQHGLRFL